ncbi:hypothetical protein DK846_17295 [Methanospirillum lacunae]|uniref:Uncharacterized protein n=1 Tax=Methanospirillum lacunae TaxID=668570 RepID=A0A2V2MW86_9EURY|nr:hypothetical protein DK846_17295 [Methanospirillum lacunae]
MYPANFGRPDIGPILHAPESCLSQHIRVPSLKTSLFRKTVRLFLEEIFPMIMSAQIAKSGEG